MMFVRPGQSSVRVLLIVLLAGCSSTKLINLWTDSNYAGPPFKQFLVIGMSQRTGERQLFEEEFVRQLAMHRGVDAVPSAGLIEAQGELNTERIAESIKGTGIDAVLVTRLVSEDRKTRHVPGRTDSFYDYYFPASRTIRSKGYITEDTIVKLETNVYAVKTMALVWSGTTESFNPPKSIVKTIDELATIVVDSLAENKML